MAPGRLTDRPQLRQQRGPFSQLAHERVRHDARVEGKLERRKRAALPGERDVTASQHVPALVVPKIYGAVIREQTALESFLCRELLAAQGGQRPLQYRHAGRIALRDLRRHTVEEEIQRARPVQRSRCRQHGLRHFDDSDPAGRTPAKNAQDNASR